MTRLQLQAQRDEIQSALEEVQATQNAYWDALGQLETALGDIELDGVSDMTDESVDSLIDEYAEEEEETDEEEEENV